MPPSLDDRIATLLAHADSWTRQAGGGAPPAMTARLHPYTHLFAPIQVNRVTLKNRIVMGPMGNISQGEETGRPSRKMVDYFAERARGGVGLITSGLVPVAPDVDPAITEPGGLSYFPRIDRSRTVFSGWRDIAEAVHAFGAHFFIQLTPGVGRVGSPECLLKKAALPVSASWNPNFYIPDVPCRPLTDGECQKIIRRAGQAAADARALLIDGVYLHGHEGYLLEQMTNPAFNRRLFGRYKDTQAFGVELVKEVRARTAPGYPIMYRIDLTLALNAVYGERMNSVKSLKHFKNERTVEMTLDYMASLVKAGVDLFDVDLGCYDNWWLPHPPNTMPSGVYLPVAKIVKDYFADQKVRSNAGLPVPVVAVGKLGYPDLAEQALRDGLCDMVMLARPLLADPHWANKAYSGRTLDITPCIGDQEACLNEFLEGGHSQCSVNPRTGFEDVFEAEPAPAGQPKRVAVVGAGPTGITCAVTAVRRGHQVTLFEARPEIGGMLVPGSRPTIKYEVANYLAHLRHQVAQAQAEHGLQTALSTHASSSMLKGMGFDSIVVCAGAEPACPPIPGADGPQVAQAVDLFRDPSIVDGARRILVAGGGAVGCECAHFLAVEMGLEVTVIELLPFFMKGVCTANRAHLLRTLEQAGVTLLNCARLKSIQPGGAVIERNRSITVPFPAVTWAPLLPENVKNPLARAIRAEMVDETIEADRVVLALGLVPNRRIYEDILRANAAPEVLMIGDGFQVGRVFEAVKAGFMVGRRL